MTREISNSEKVLLKILHKMYKESDFEFDYAYYDGIRNMSDEEFEKFQREAYADDDLFEDTFEEYLLMVIDDFGKF